MAREDSQEQKQPEPTFFSKLFSERGIAIAAWLTAVIALFVSFIDSCQTRRHNRMSVQPNVEIVTQMAYDREMVGTEIQNTGVGPAVILKSEIFFDGDLVQHWNEATFAVAKQDSVDEVERKISRTWNNEGPSWYVFGSRGYMMAEKASLMVYALPAEAVTNWEKFKNLIYRRMQLRLTYTSVYREEKWQVCLNLDCE